MAPYSIGIDLGTANTRVAAYRDGHVEIIPDVGARAMPSYVAFTETGRFVGTAAKNQVNINPENTVFDALRFIGCKFSDAALQADMKHFPFRVLDRAGKPVISVEYRGRTKYLTPEEILSMILTKAKKTAEAYLDHTVSSAVIIVPSYFNFHQRRTIRDVALVSELHVLDLINAPTAAAITYTFESPISNIEKNVLIAGLGAGTCNAALVRIEEGVIEVISTAGDNHLGGEDFDNRLVNHILGELMGVFELTSEASEQWVMKNARTIRRLRTACEHAKHKLSSQRQTYVQVDSLSKGIDFRATVTRTKFEEICQDLFRRVIEPIKQVLSDAKMDKSSIHDIVIVGSSFRIPRMQELLADLFDGRKAFKRMDIDEAAASGAAILAAILSGYHCEQGSKLDSLLLLDVVPLSLGIETYGGIMTPLIKRNTFSLTKRTQTFSTFVDNQVSFDLSVFEGEQVRAKDNTLLGTASLPLPPMPRGVPVIEVIFECYSQGLSSVTALEKQEGKKVTIRFWIAGALSREEIERMQLEAKKYDADENAEADRVSARNALESYAFTLKNTFPCSEIDSNTAQGVIAAADMILAWLEDNASADATEYRLRQMQLENLSANISTQHSGIECSEVDSSDALSIRGKRWQPGTRSV